MPWANLLLWVHRLYHTFFGEHWKWKPKEIIYYFVTVNCAYIPKRLAVDMSMCVHIHVPVCVYFGVIDGKMSEDKKWISIPSVWIRKSQAWLLNSSCTEQRHERSQPCSQSNTNVQDLASSPKAEDLKAHVGAICHLSDTMGALHIIQISDLRMDNLKDTKVHNMDNSQSFHQCQHENILSEF